MSENVYLWSVTASENDDADPAVPWPEGMLPGAVNNGARATMAAFARYLKDTNGSLATTGSANAYVITPNIAYTTHLNGLNLRAKANFSNTAAATLNVNALGAKKIRTFGPSGERDAVVGQIQSGGTYDFRYDSAADSASGAWILLNPSRNGEIEVGTIKIFAGALLETGWYWCDGTLLSQTDDAALFAKIGTAFNIGGEAAGTFRVPDLQGRIPAARDGGTGRITTAGSDIDGVTVGAAGGLQNVTLNSVQIPPITPAGSISQFTPAGTVQPSGGSAGQSYTPAGTVQPSGGGAGSAYTPTGTNSTSATNSIPVFPTGAGGGGTRFLSDTPTGVTTTFGVTAQTFTGDAKTFTFTGTGQALTFTGSTSTLQTFTGTQFGGGGAHTNMPPTLIVNFAIRYTP